MSKLLLSVSSLLACSSLVLAASGTGQIQLTKSCTTCHPISLIEQQHLSRAEWDQKLTQMQKFGAHIENRAVLLEYLSRTYSAGKPEAGKRTTAKMASLKSRS